MSDPRQMREGLTESVRLDLLGPVEDDELLFDYRVRDRYLVGMLATDGTQSSTAAQGKGEEPDVDKPAAEAHDGAVDQATVEKISGKTFHYKGSAHAPRLRDVICG